VRLAAGFTYICSHILSCVLYVFTQVWIWNWAWPNLFWFALLHGSHLHAFIMCSEQSASFWVSGISLPVPKIQVSIRTVRPYLLKHAFNAQCMLLKPCEADLWVFTSFSLPQANSASVKSTELSLRQFHSLHSLLVNLQNQYMEETRTVLPRMDKPPASFEASIHDIGCTSNKWDHNKPGIFE
jgi:hypothetical protein